MKGSLLVVGAAFAVGRSGASGEYPADAVVVCSFGDASANHSTALGALNAAHASDTALANASPNSRVGKIAAYKEAELAAKAATADAAAADQKVADAQAAAATADATVQAAQDEADAALVNAANKDITDDSGNVLTDVRDAVNHLLGID